MDRERAPTRPDFQQVVGLLQVQLSAEAVVLGRRGLGQGGLGSLEDTAGVGHGLVQKKGVEVVAQVVVGLDVAAAAFRGVLVSPVVEFAQRGGQQSQAPLDLEEPPSFKTTSRVRPGKSSQVQYPAM